MKNLSFRFIAALFIICFFCFSAKKSAAQLTPGDFAIIGFNGNATTVNLGIVALKTIPSGTVLKITDQGWDQSALVTNGSDGLITWTTTSSIPAGTIFNIAITGGASPTATGLEAFGTATAVGWTTGTVVAGGGDNWFLYSGSDASPNFIYGFANWSTALPGTNAPDPVTGWEAAGTVTAAVSYLPTTLATGNFYVTLTIAGTPPTGYHGDYNNYSGTLTGTKASILTAINIKSNWTTTELLANKKSLDPGGVAFPVTNPIFQLGTNVSGVTSTTANGTYKIADVIAVNVTFSAVVTVTGTPQLSLNTGALANYSGGSGTNTLNFNYTVASGQSIADLDYSSTTALTLNGGTIKDAGSVDATLTLAAPGAANSLGNNKNIVIDGVVPTVTSVNSSTANGAYKNGDIINVTLNFSEAITVTGTPQLTLNSGGTASYASGSGTSSLSFSYTVQPTDASADLDYTSTTALGLNGGTLKDGAGNNATLTLPSPGAANSLGINKNIVVDNTIPVVSSVNSSLANGTYKIADIIPVTVNFSEAVTVTGTPTLSLNSGGTANYASGSGTSALVFNYTVALNQSIADLDQASTTALTLAGGTIKDGAGNNATLTLAAPGAAGSLGANKNIVIDTTVPTVLSITRIGNAAINSASAQFLVTFSENVTGVNTNAFTITTSGGITGASVSLASGSSSTWTITVNTGTGSGSLKLNLKSAGTGILNGVGNEIQTGYTTGEIYTIDKVIPTLTAVAIVSNNTNTARAKTGDIVTLSFSASETIGTPVVNIFGNAATAITNTSANNWTATYTTQATDVNGVIPFNIAFTDVAGNAGTAVTATTNSSSVTFDKTLPTLTTVAIVSNNPSNQVAIPGNVITLSFTASEAVTLPTVTIAGSPVIPVSAGGNSFTAAYTLTGTETEGVIPFNIAFTDLAGNTGTPVTATTNSSSVTYDISLPTLSTVTIASNNLSNSRAKTGDIVTLNFTASEPVAIPTVTIAGTAAVPINSGGNNWTATRTVAIGTPEGILAFNIAFSDLAGNAGTPVTATTNSSSVTVDRTAPATPTGLASTPGDTQNILSWNASAAPDIDKYIIYGGPVNPNAVIQVIPAGTLTYTHTGLTNGLTYFYSISAVDLTGNESPRSTPNVLSTPKATQTITFNPLAASTYGASPITLTATASSGLAVTYTSSNTGVATVSGNTVTVVGQGTTTITALQGGNTSFLPATSVTQDLVVNKKEIAVTAAAKTKVYGTLDPAFTYTFSPALTGLDTFTGTLDRATGENTGAYTINQGTLALSSNYNITFTPADLVISTKPITVTAAAKTKIFTAADPALTYTFSPALIGTDTFTGNLDRAAGEDVGNYAIGQNNLSLGTNYQITYVPANLTITTKAITVTATAKTKVYGEANPALTYTFSPALNGTDAFTGALDRVTGENIGNYAIGQGTLALSSNYALNYTTADLSITKKTVAVTATAGNKEYGTADPAFAYTFSPALIGTDTFTGNLDRATGENIGNYAIGQGTLALSNNYTLNYTSADFSITRKTVNVTAAVKTKIYGVADPALTYTFSPALIGTDTFTGNLDRATGENIGNYAIGQGTLALNANYTLAFTSADLSITTKPVTVTAAAKSKIFADSDPALTYTFSPALIGTDTFTGNLNRTAGENIGNYAINQGNLSLGTNYLITYVPANLTITSQAIIVTATAKTKVYGEADPVLTYTFSPALNGTDTFTGNLDRTTGENIGNYAINQGNLSLSPNYALVYNGANLGITKRTVAVTATAVSKEYGTADPVLAYTFSPALIGTDAFTGSVSRVAGENIGNYAIGQGTLALSNNYTLNYATADFSITKKTVNVTATLKTKVYGTADPALTYTFSPALIGTDVFTGSLNRAAGENIGNYAIGQGTLALNANYTLAFTSADLNITSKPLTLTAVAKTKIYGAADPALTYTFSPALIGTDAFTGNLTRTAGENIGNYAIAQGTVTAGPNYLITYNPANLSITNKALTVTAVAKTKIYGEADPALTYTFSPALIGTDAFTGSLTRTAGENIGSYAIAQGTVTAGPNYLITYNPANLSIGTKTVTATATPAAKTYGTADPALTYTFSPALIGTDAFTGSLNRVPGENTGTYAINKNTLALNSNYVLNYTAANLTINKTPLTITAEDKVKFAGTANPALTIKYDGFVNAETPAALTSPVVISTTATTNSPIGTYDIVVSAATSNNYQISFVKGTLTIRPGAPTNILVAGTTVYENSPAGTPAGTISSTSDDPGATFTYALVSGAGDTDNASFSISGNNLLTAASLNFENKASYSIRVKSTTQYGFSLEKSFNISISDVNEIPTLDPINSQTICYTTAAQNVALTGITAGPETAQTTTITATSSNNNLFQNITATKTGSSGNISYRVRSGASGTATITVTVKDNGGTDNGGVDTYTRTFVITVNPLPIVTIAANIGTNTTATGTEVSKGETLQLTATGGVSYVWATHSSIISGQNTATLTVRPRETTTYTVTATNASGCTDSKTFTVTVVEDYAKVKATNILSPNGDGYNDKWVIDNIDFYPNNEVKIFDKSGRPIYSKKGYDNSWDGTLNGAALSEGTYYFVLDFGTARPKFKGFITVVREN
jgi:gliding motility-associated-like protein